MKKGLFRRHRSVRLSALVLGGLLCASTTSAATLVTAVATDYADSQMGTLTGSHVNTLVNDPANEGLLKNLGGDASVFNVHQYGVSKLLLKYNTGGETTYRLLNPNALTETSEGAKGKLSSVTNPHAVAATDQFIYVAGYDQGKIGVLHEDDGMLKEQNATTVDLKNDIKQYAGYQFTESYTDHDTGVTQTGNPTDAKVHGEALFINGRNLYAAVSVNPTGSWDSYDDGFLMHYKIKDDGSLTFAGSTRIGRNTDQVRLNRFNDHILLTAIGGKQNTGAGNPSHTGIDIVQTGNDGTVSAATTKKVVLPAHIKSTGEDLRDLKVMPNGTAYVMTYNLTTDGKIDAHVYQTTVSNLLSSNPQDWTELATVQNADGSSGKIDAEYTTKNLWMQFGNTLQRYRDGDSSATDTWQAKDFSSNKAHSNFNKFLKVETDYVTGPLASVVLTQPSELGGTTNAAKANTDAVWKNNAAVTESVTSSQDFSEDTVVSIGKDKIGDPTTNAASAIYAMTGEVTIDAGTNTLQLQSENTVGNPTGIYAGNGSSVTLTAKKINVITKGLDGGNSLTNAIHLDDDGDNGHVITLNGDVNISMSGGLGGNGIAIQNRDHFGEPSMGYNAGPYVEINGNLRIAGSDTGKWGIPLNYQNVISRYNNAGILTRTAGSSVTISGDANMSVYGNGVTVNGADYATPLVTIAGGGRIQVPSGMKYSYYALAAYMGEISMNMGANGNAPGTRDVQLDGDLFAHKNGGSLKIALTTSHSWLHGLVDAGYAELYLRNGSIWLNEARNERYHQDLEDIGAGEVVSTGKDRCYVGKSRLIKFFGGENEAERGIIYQRDANPITINNYSGHAAVIYNHDAAVPSMFKTGGIVIDKAVGTENVLTLFTDANGITAANQSAVLNALANKLTYKNYADKKLTGRLAISEGLTTSSIQKDITFATEQGSYQAPAPPTSNEQTTTEFTKRLFGTTDQEYVDAHVKQTDGTYRFTKDSTITYQNGSDMNRGAIKPNEDVQIDSTKCVLTVKSGGRTANVKQSAAISNDGKKLDIKAKTLKLLVNDTTSAAPLQSAWGIRTTGGTTQVTGMTEIDVGGTKESKAIHASGGTVTLDSLHATTNAAAEEAATLYAQNNGRINVNMDHNNGGTGSVTLDGHIVAKDAASRVDAAIYGKSSHLKGFVYGDGTTNLWLQNGGVWENEKRGANVPTGFTGSHVSELTGGGQPERAGLIFQRDEKKITIDKYFGHTKVFFTHDAATPTNIKGGDLVIKSAGGGSRITLVTDQTGQYGRDSGDDREKPRERDARRARQKAPVYGLCNKRAPSRRKSTDCRGADGILRRQTS